MPIDATTSQMTGPVAAAISWFYLVTNSARVFTYIPQIVAVWRCKDGARAISLVTWGSWVVSHLAAIGYGALVVHDTFFLLISAINFTCCGAVVTIAAHRRGLLGRNAQQPPPARAATSSAAGGGSASDGRARLLR